MKQLDGQPRQACGRMMPPDQKPSYRSLVGIGGILLLILVWAGFVAAMARIVGTWPVIVQAPFYLIMGIAWIIPLKPLVRWMQTGSRGER